MVACYSEHKCIIFLILFPRFNVFFSREECKFYDQLERIILKDRTSESQDISELESITDSDSGVNLNFNYLVFFFWNIVSLYNWDQFFIWKCLNIICKVLQLMHLYLWNVFACPDSLALSKPLTADGPKLAWGDSETHTLISIWGSDAIQERLKGCVKRKPVFQQIALVMAEKGYSRTDEQCRSRIKRLKASYRQCLDNYR